MCVCVCVYMYVYMHVYIVKRSRITGPAFGVGDQGLLSLPHLISAHHESAPPPPISQVNFMRGGRIHL